MPIAHLTNDLQLHYEDYGTPNAPPVVFLHAATQTFRTSWSAQIEPFAADFRVVGVDMRGHGKSTNPADALDLRQIADDIADLLDHLDIDKTNVVGFSGGASAALFFAARHLHRLITLTMVSNNMELDTARTEQDFWNFERVQREDPKWLAHMQAIHEAAVPDLLRWWREEDGIRPNWRTAELEHIDVPSLVVGGDRDPIIPLGQTLLLFETLPNAQLCVLPGVGHGIPARRPEAFNPILRRFLAKFNGVE
jgi:pimeloyl-ACP methyl ester carboxylesterase